MADATAAVINPLVPNSQETVVFYRAKANQLALRRYRADSRQKVYTQSLGNIRTPSSFAALRYDDMVCGAFRMCLNM